MKWIVWFNHGAIRFGTVEGDLVQPYAGDFFAGPTPDGPEVPLAAITPVGPLRPRNFIGLWNNFHALAEKQGNAIPEFPLYFLKSPTSIIGPDCTITPPPGYDGKILYEGELGIVIGRDQSIFGYTIVNDVTARHLQKRHSQWILGKGLDSFCPMGPAILTADEVPDPRLLELTTWVNGTQRQHAPVSDLIFDIPTLIEAISAAITLEPGDVVATGTPAGVGIGLNPPVFMQRGDVVRISVTGIGVLENTVR